MGKLDKISYSFKMDEWVDTPKQKKSEEPEISEVNSEYNEDIDWNEDFLEETVSEDIQDEKSGTETITFTSTQSEYKASSNSSWGDDVGDFKPKQSLKNRYSEKPISGSLYYSYDPYKSYRPSGADKSSSSGNDSSFESSYKRYLKEKRQEQQENDSFSKRMGVRKKSTEKSNNKTVNIFNRKTRKFEEINEDKYLQIIKDNKLFENFGISE